MAHATNPSPYSTLVHTVLFCKLCQRLLSFNMVFDYILRIKAFASNRLAAAVKTFVQLTTSFFCHFSLCVKPRNKSRFLAILFKMSKGNHYQALPAFSAYFLHIKPKRVLLASIVGIKISLQAELVSPEAVSVL